MHVPWEDNGEPGGHMNQLEKQSKMVFLLIQMSSHGWGRAGQDTRDQDKRLGQSLKASTVANME